MEKLIKALASARGSKKRRKKRSPIAKNPNDLANAYINEARDFLMTS